MNRPTPVVLALHYQNDVLHPEGRIRVGLDDAATRTALIESAGRLLALARRERWPIIHVRIAFRPDYADLARTMPIFRRTAEIGAVREGDWGADFFDALAPQASPREFVLKHISISAFQGTPMDQLLRQLDARRLFVAGVATHSVVESTVREAADRGYEVSVVADACAAAQRATHEAALASMSLMAEVTTVDGLVAEISAREAS